MLEHELVQQAQDLAKSEAVDIVFRRLEEQFTQGWKNTAPDNQDHREHCFRMVLALNALRAEIKSLADADRVRAWNRRNLAADTTLR